MLTPAQKAKIRQKEEALPQALKRDPLSQYLHGYFFVTLNTRNESPILSIVAGSPTIPDNQPGAPHCEYTELGQRVKAVWEAIPKYHSEVVVCECEVMPEHLHSLLYLKPGNKAHLGRIIGGVIGGCTHAYWDTLGIDWRKNHPTQGANAQAENRQPVGNHWPPDRDRDHTHSYRGPSLFVRGYNDVIPITEQEVQIKRQYIRDQARKRLIQGDRHQCFKIQHNARSTNWNKEAVSQAIRRDPFLARNPNLLKEAMCKVQNRLNGDDTAYFLDYLGNRSLLASANKLPLICHRADATCFEQQKAAVLYAAQHGTTIVSAFISPKEREIKAQLLQLQAPFIEIMDNGFSDRYKPSGQSFYACGESRLVQITPWKYAYHRDSHITRETCLVMNELARIICKCEDDWWKRMLASLH